MPENCMDFEISIAVPLNQVIPDQVFKYLDPGRLPLLHFCLLILNYFSRFLD